MEFVIVHKIPPIDIHCHIQAVYGDKCVDVSTVSCWVQQFEQEEVGEVVVSGGGGVGPFFMDGIQKHVKHWRKHTEVGRD